MVWVPWTSRTTDWNDALASGKNAPDITELGNTDTPTEASLGVLTNVSSYVNSWSGKAGLVSGMLANDVQNGDVYAVPWFGGVRGVWYRTDQFTKAGITSPPTTWAQLVTDAQKLQQTFPGTYGIDAITDDTNAFASFLWGSGGQIATQSNGTWTANLTSPADEAAIKFYVSLYSTYHLSPSKYIGQTELGNTGSTSGGANTDFGLGKLDLYIDGPWATATMPANSTDKSNWASFPIPSENGPNAAPVFAGGSDLAIFKTSKYQQADWDLISVMDNTANSTSFANLQGFFPPYSSRTDQRPVQDGEVHVRLRGGRREQPGLAAERQELADRRHRQVLHHPRHAQVADERRSVRLDRRVGQLAAPDRAEHRHRELGPGV